MAGSGGAATSGTSGESGSGGSSSESESGSGGGTTSTMDKCPADPADGVVVDGCGVWVSSTLGKDSNPGTQAMPLKTIAQAVALAQDGSNAVYACGEEFFEPVSLPSGTSLFGGFDCENGWTYGGAAKRATIAPTAGAPALTLFEGAGESRVGDVIAKAAHGSLPGGSSVAVFALDNAKATIVRSDLIAGDGADGLGGEHGNPNGEPAASGAVGQKGANACTAEVGMGGLLVGAGCVANGDSFGGKGGDGGTSIATAGTDGQPFNVEGYGGGGLGEMDAPKCKGGELGFPGADGPHGFGAAGKGRLAPGGYLGVAGKDGGLGAAGQGGGGGGASYGKALICGPVNAGGAGGGSGGAGGCGGKGAKGGLPGGASLGLATRSGGITLHQVRIATGNGGSGGAGGLLQAGGQGGLPGTGGLGLGGQGGVNGGCAGGVGGQGGNGGNGGGGLGGPSIGIVYVGVGTVAQESVTIAHGAAGKGGPGGNPSLPGTSGEDGMAVDTLSLEP